MCTCTICRCHENGSLEHIIPDAIGGTITTECICKDCNCELGKTVDCLLTDDPLFLLIRSVLKVPNRDKKIPNIYSKRLDWRDNKSEKVVFSKNDSETDFPKHDISERPVVIVEQTDSPDKVNIFFTGSDYDAIITKVYRELTRYGMKISRDDLVHLLPIDSLTIKNQQIECKHEMNLCWENYYPCLLKIAFEVCCDKFGIDYLNDPTGNSIRIYLYNMIHNIPCELPKFLFKNCSYTPNFELTHKITILNEEERIFVEILLFKSLYCKIYAGEIANVSKDIPLPYSLIIDPISSLEDDHTL